MTKPCCQSCTNSRELKDGKWTLVCDALGEYWTKAGFFIRHRECNPGQTDIGQMTVSGDSVCTLFDPVDDLEPDED